MADAAVSDGAWAAVPLELEAAPLEVSTGFVVSTPLYATIPPDDDLLVIVHVHDDGSPTT